MAEAATIARPYATAAFMSARDTKALPAWSEALRLSAGLIGDPSIADLLTSPKMTMDQLVLNNSSKSINAISYVSLLV